MLQVSPPEYEPEPEPEPEPEHKIKRNNFSTLKITLNNVIFVFR